MIIPIEELSNDTLTAILEEFVLREGTEYGAEDVSLTQKIAQIFSESFATKTSFITFCS